MLIMSSTEKISVTVQEDGSRTVTAVPTETIQWGTEKGPVKTVEAAAEPMDTSVPAETTSEMDTNDGYTEPAFCPYE